MEKSSFRGVAMYASFSCVLMSSCISSFGQGTATGAKTQSGGAHYEVQLSEKLLTEDHVAVKLTLGQKKAIAGAQALGPDKGAVFNSDGALVRKGPLKELDKDLKACKDLQPISDKCWLCKDNGTILCGASPQQQQSKPDSTTSHVKPNSP